ncbi:hypothetical protein COW36_03830 [bacterium (Candidatus Blackallbacteria) CG17_big_fil_post_rev_8_21_14_2_50_48_46]|uniref:Uncharacterized protein n=1 Tax=bacterium (Candidatus Blackallbacteria) CG17_big_fil_post_rev_8_21_14_2_50_48_46 TaxID=2014261 RepID=A0A2M7G8J8_9BACT|nr:MAG: hypothetical protein COW64_05115 [bacterium (Candidatus Blackallbacteria) CG18_big_fil_WC_8_21_14_2_50_49_26]PIW18430.1 MAG: hypothetical protein COW36_03830 [bacterium (Candidatus Blackallbacteria) CG17_big_fil_post_rev_8_21_14_2_50_48_46]PIW46585.1 MAG: hypothetical protein COW20_16850 [bacterium (Candidatus Blackallbacteria) CG13_big_fil_rev_8_21_14_2_50_49_14]
MSGKKKLPIQADQHLSCGIETEASALSHVGFLSEAPVRGAKKFEDLAIQQDAWSKIQTHFKTIYSGKKSDRQADIEHMAQRLGVEASELQPLVNQLYENQLISPLMIDLGVTELFFRREGFAKAKNHLKSLDAFLKNPDSRLTPFERNKIASSVFRDLAVPAMIGQGGKGSCAAASLQVLTASAHPNQYLKMVLNLAEGKPVALPDGQTLQPNDDWRDAQKEDRQLSEAVLQNAYMDLMLGKGKYHSNLDEGANQTAPSAGQQRKGLEKLAGPGVDYDDTATIMCWPLSTLSASSGMGYLEDEIARGRPVLVNVWGHAMAVVGIDKTQRDPKVLVCTYGAQIEMPSEGLEKYLMHTLTIDDPGPDNLRVQPGQRVVIGTDLGRLPPK